MKNLLAKINKYWTRIMAAFFVWMLALIAVIVAIGIFIFDSYFPFKTVVVYNEPFPILNQEPVHTGDTLDYQVTYHKYTEVPASVARTLVCGSIRISEAGGSRGSQVGKTPDNVPSETFTSESYVIPDNAPLGVDCHIEVVNTYQINIFRAISVEVHTDVFQISPKVIPVSTSMDVRQAPSIDAPGESFTVSPTPTDTMMANTPTVPQENQATTTPAQQTDNSKKMNIIDPLPDVLTDIKSLIK